MKVLCSQEVVSPHLCEVVPCQVTAQVSAPQGPWCVRCVWLQQGVRKDLACSKPTDFEALSWGSFRKTACNLIETAQRKSQKKNPAISLIELARPLYSAVECALLRRGLGPLM